MLVVNVPFLDHERALCIVVPQTTSVIDTRFEITVAHPGLKAGAFDVQQTAAVQAVKVVRRLGALNAEQMATKEGKENPFVRKRDLRSLCSPKAERVLRVLLSAPGRRWKVQPLATEAGVSLGQGFNVKKLLVDREWVETGDDGFRVSIINLGEFVEKRSQFTSGEAG